MVKGRLHIVMAEDDRAALFFAAVNLVHQLSLNTELDIGHKLRELGLHQAVGFLNGGGFDSHGHMLARVGARVKTVLAQCCTFT